MKKSEDVIHENIQTQEIYPNGAFFSVLQLEIDLLPPPKAQRILQWINRNGILEVYATESAFVRSELKDHLNNMVRLGLDNIGKGAASFHPIKTRLHWVRFTEEFCKTGKGPRMNPETGLAEEAVN